MWTRENITKLGSHINRVWNGGCWDWVAFFRREFCGLETPTVPYDAQRFIANAHLITRMKADLDFCYPVETPQDGDIVCMGHGQWGMHVGAYASLDHGVVLHVERGREVLATPISRLAWSVIEFRRLKEAA